MILSILKPGKVEFTLKQLFNIVDGRLMTDINDIDAVLSAAIGEEIQTDTHRLFAMETILKNNPEWYQQANVIFLSIQDKIGTNIDNIEKYIDDNYSDFKIKVTRI